MQSVLDLLSVAAEEEEGSCEYSACGCGHQDDRVAVGTLSFRRGGGGVVLALGAALGMERCGKAESSEERGCGEMVGSPLRRH